MELQSNDCEWYALYVRERYEKIAASQLSGRGYEVYLPTYQSRRRWSDRTKTLEVPLFPTYMFCRFDFRQRLPILTVPGVNFIVGVGKTPAPVEVKELDAVRLAVSSGLHCEPWPFLEAGHSVRVEHGPLTGLEGFVLNVKNSYRLIISVNLLGRSVSVEVDRDSVKPIPSAKAMAAAS
jgi:transcription antitermination factor NusG